MNAKGSKPAIANRIVIGVAVAIIASIACLNLAEHVNIPITLLKLIIGVTGFSVILVDRIYVYYTARSVSASDT